MRFPVILFEFGGDFWLFPEAHQSELMQIESGKEADLVYRANWYRIGWLFFALGIIFETNRELRLKAPIPPAPKGAGILGD